VHWSYYKEVFTDYYVRGESPGHTHFLYIAIILLFTCEYGGRLAGNWWVVGGKLVALWMGHAVV